MHSGNRKARSICLRPGIWLGNTYLNDHEMCVYGIRDEKGIIKCAFEQAYSDGKTDLKKPISCHLYPIIHTRRKKGGVRPGEL